ncbi:EamA family transporter [Spirosoma aerophilum]
MNERLKWLLIVLGLELISVLGDYFIKKASLQNGWMGWKQLLLGGLIYGATAIGWFYVMRTFKLFTIGLIHSLLAIALSMVLSQLFFDEKITPRDIVGIVLGLASIILLIRYQG